MRLTQRQRRLTAAHEAGHATIAFVPRIVHRTKPKTKKHKPAGWRTLPFELLSYWCLLWEEKRDNVVIMNEANMGLIIHRTRSTVNRWNHQLHKAGAVQVIPRQDKQGHQMTSIIVVHQPPDELLRLRFAQALRLDVPRATLHAGKAADFSITSTACKVEPCTTTTSIVNEEPVRDISLDSVNRKELTNTKMECATLHTDETRINSGDDPRATLHKDTRLTDAERKTLQELREELAGWQGVGRGELAAKAEQEIAEFLKGRIE